MPSPTQPAKDLRETLWTKGEWPTTQEQAQLVQTVCRQPTARRNLCERRCDVLQKPGHWPIKPCGVARVRRALRALLGAVVEMVMMGFDPRRYIAHYFFAYHPVINSPIFPYFPQRGRNHLHHRHLLPISAESAPCSNSTRSSRQSTAPPLLPVPGLRPARTSLRPPTIRPTIGLSL